jgi:hypothetical protein
MIGEKDDSGHFKMPLGPNAFESFAQILPAAGMGHKAAPFMSDQCEKASSSGNEIATIGRHFLLS